MSDVAVIVAAEAFEPAALLTAFSAGAHEAGAIVSFSGVCRASSQGAAVTALTLEHFPEFTEAEITRIARETAHACGVAALFVRHRVGRILPGEAIVFVAAASAHRRAAFLAVDRLMDYLKTDAPFWKREERTDGAAWIEPRADDAADRARWEDA